ncbi:MULTISPECIES: hypothetical protein [unclassified Lysobacter]|uniref:hypothetical protein n=1 Tax=unclassified Lysobacter TaxID=2635362 RepID=UPI001BECEF4F|nr:MULTISPECIES: hypothetical protein [unclassified Lysobacter]MBT2750046.1 hypothetical protein [Lysobacter sp. ISL-50]MBT2775382.1 hypothetical protein [Lysobacter sp. ISL-54]MBT2783505.1 hypothetical protein [Lysobacter sp. ISL-52]
MKHCTPYVLHATLLALLAPHASQADASELGSLGGSRCIAIDVNNAGAAIGQCRTTEGDFAVTYWASTSVAAMALPGLEFNGPCTALGISGNDVVTGNCERGEDGESFPVRWLTPSLPSTTPQTLNARTGDDRAEATFINAAGTVAGISTSPDGTDHPVLWKSGQIQATSLPVPGLLPPLLSSITECHITALGVAIAPAVVGFCDLRQGGSLAVKWTPTTSGGYSVASLPRIPGGSNCVAVAVNPNGYIAGTCEDPVGDLAAVRWRLSGGAPAMLRGLPREAAVGQQVMAADINATGTVIGNYYTSDGLQRGFVWVPTDDPATEDGLDLGTLGGAVVRVQQVSDNGTIIGTAESPQGASAGFAWSPSSNIQDLGTLGGTYNHPAAISPNGMWIVGASTISSGQRLAYRIGPIQADIPKLVRSVSPKIISKGLIGLAGLPFETAWCATLGRESTHCPGGR